MVGSPSTLMSAVVGRGAMVVFWAADGAAGDAGVVLGGELEGELEGWGVDASGAAGGVGGGESEPHPVKRARDRDPPSKPMEMEWTGKRLKTWWVERNIGWGGSIRDNDTST